MYARVIVDIIHSKVDRFFTYGAPQELRLQPGFRVQVPFANKTIEGLVMEISDTCDIDPVTVRQVSGVIGSYPAITQELIAIAHYIRDKYNTTLAQALRLMIPAQVRHAPSSGKMRRVVFLVPQKLEEAKAGLIAKNGAVKYPAQKQVLEALERNNGISASQLNASALKALAKKGFVQIRETPGYETEIIEQPFPPEDVELTPRQQDSVNEILREPGGRFLLHGVTGSGKTEVYIRIIRNVLKRGKTAILLVPEISLTPQTYWFLKKRLPQKIAVFHSGLSAAERLREWKKVREGKAQIVLGARSAVFAPLCDLGAIIIDEEHENTYTADSFPAYTALEIAEKRCDYTGATLVLGSATPSVQTYWAAQQGRYTLLSLPMRVHGLTLPRVRIVDMRQEVQKGNTSAVSGLLYSELEKTLQQGRQAMLFLNRRGYSTAVMCLACGYTASCDACDVSLTYHKASGKMKCHYCGRSKPLIHKCPECGRPYIKLYGLGTQQVEEQVRSFFPRARILRMDLDTMSTKDAHARVYRDFVEKKADILIGTQMITKGFDFENVRLSAVLSAETMLNIPEYRSAERAFILMTQVAGRAGRREAGEVVLQTYHPDNYAVRYAAMHDYEGFFNEEIALRESANLPPFTALIEINFSGKNEEITVEAVREFLKKLRIALDDCRKDILSVRAGEAQIRRINKMVRFAVYLNIKKPGEECIRKVLAFLAGFRYEGVLVGLQSSLL